MVREKSRVQARKLLKTTRWNSAIEACDRERRSTGKGSRFLHQLHAIEPVKTHDEGMLIVSFLDGSFANPRRPWWPRRRRRTRGPSFRPYSTGRLVLAAKIQARGDDNDSYQSLHRGRGRTGEAIFVGDEEKILRCLGAAAIMKWDTLPTKLQRELFEAAGSMDELMDAIALRGQIARPVHRRRDERH